MIGSDSNRDEPSEGQRWDERGREPARDSDSQGSFATAAQWGAIGMGAVGVAAVVRILLGVL